MALVGSMSCSEGFVHWWEEHAESAETLVLVEALRDIGRMDLSIGKLDRSFRCFKI